MGKKNETNLDFHGGCMGVHLGFAQDFTVLIAVPLIHSKARCPRMIPVPVKYSN